MGHLVNAASMQGKFSADDILKCFSYRLWHFMQIASLGDNLHEIRKSYFLGKIRKNQ